MKFACCLGNERKPESARCVEFSPVESNLLASTSSEIYVCLWNTQTKECIACFNGHASCVSDLAFSPHGNLLASSSFDHTIRLWNVKDQQSSGCELHGHAEPVFCVKISPNGNFLASASNSSVRLWNMPNGIQKHVLYPESYCTCIAFSLASNILVVGCWDGRINLYDTCTSALVQTIKGSLDKYVHAIDVSPDGHQLASSMKLSEILLWEIMDDGKLARSKTISGPLNKKAFREVVYHPDGKQLVSISHTSIVYLWTLCKWTDRNHNLFGSEIKRYVFQLMCVRQWLEIKNDTMPRLPIELWLLVFESVHCCLHEINASSFVLLKKIKFIHGK